ncbi:MAG: SIS domain-containing protein [Planctomycetota bacterium]|nr:SIS domain-containing protein [Planctomycetota bacterium]
MQQGKEPVSEGMREAVRILEAMLSAAPAEIEGLADRIADALRRGGRVFLFGNGGSAADAQHIACELVGRLRGDRPALSATAFSTDTSVLTALGNDRGFEQIFSRQVEAHVREGDVVIGLSTSGRSPNVLEGLETARRVGALTVAFTGQDDSPITEAASVSIRIPSSDTPRIQEAHILVGHLLCDAIERRLV